MLTNVGTYPNLLFLLWHPSKVLDFRSFLKMHRSHNVRDRLCTPAVHSVFFFFLSENTSYWNLW